MHDPSTSPSRDDPNSAAGDSPPSAWPIVLRFDVTVDDMVAFYVGAGNLDPVVKRAWDKVRAQYRASVITLFVLIAILVVFSSLLWTGQIALESGMVIAVAIGAAVAGAGWTVSQYRRALRPVSQFGQFATMARTDESRYHTGPQTLSIGPSGLSLCQRHHDTVQRWSGITAIRETPDGIYFQRADRHCFLLPKRIFASVDEAKSVVEQARQWLDQSGHGESRRVRSFLAERDVPCPACGYNLRGAKSDRCPECARPLDAGLVEAPP